MKVSDMIQAIKQGSNNDPLIQMMRIIRKRQRRGQDQQLDKIRNYKRTFLYKNEIDERDVIQQSKYAEEFDRYGQPGEIWDAVINWYLTGNSIDEYMDQLNQYVIDQIDGETGPGRDEDYMDWLFDRVDSMVTNATKELFDDIMYGEV